MIAYDRVPGDDDLFMYTVDGSYPSTLKLEQKVSVPGLAFDIAIAQNNSWVALDQFIYRFDGGTLDFFQDVGICWDVEFSAECDFFFCSEDELRIYKNGFPKEKEREEGEGEGGGEGEGEEGEGEGEEGFPTWAIVVIVIASVCFCSIFIGSGVFCYRKQRQERYREQELEEREGKEVQRRQGQKEERRSKYLKEMDSDHNFLGRHPNP